MLAVRRLTARRLASVARLCTSSNDRPKSSDRFHDVDILDADAWKTPIGKEHLGDPGISDPCNSGLRFPVGTPVRCFVGDDNWLGGTVVAQNYRETEWPEDRPSAPYCCQVAHSAPTSRPLSALSDQLRASPGSTLRICPGPSAAALLPDTARA